MIVKKPYLWVLLFSLIAAIIRFWNIGFQYMNSDEVWTINFVPASMSAWQVLIHTLSTDYNPPLYYLCAHFSMLLFGETATAIRIPSAIAGVLLVPVMYYLGKEYKDELFGLLLSGLTVFLYTFVFYSRYGRSYSVAILFFALAFLYFLKLVKDDHYSSMPFGIFAVLALWTHLYTVIPLGVMVLYILWSRLDLAGIVVMILGAIPLLNYVPLVLSTRSIESAAVKENFGFSPTNIILFSPLDWFNYSFLIVTPIIIWSLWKHRGERAIQLIAAIWGVTWASMVALSGFTPILMHYGLWCVPLLLIAFVLPFYEMIRNYKIKEISYAYVVVIVLFGLLEIMQIVWLLTQQRISMAL